MKALNKQTLREAAEKATPGPWRYLKTTPFMDAEISAKNHTRVVNLLAGDVTANNSEFIAAANPATVLALLDELETKEEQRTNWFQMAQKLGEDLDAAEKRIAELEARAISIPEVRITVAESKRKNLTWRELGAYNEGADVAKEAILAVIRAAGISVKGE
ncbi:ead/Ea22-like family protein [Citrobacter werkmanii]|nr:ead/Ea22-like family protein [Citrobacter werkmanii]MBJ9599681.1 ead/Ea22-like family protein [Citrobacter werkmanii]